jgi:hypothetical protein
MSRVTVAGVSPQRPRSGFLVAVALVALVTVGACHSSDAPMASSATTTTGSAGSSVPSPTRTDPPGTTNDTSVGTTPAPTTTLAVGDEAQIRQVIDTYWTERLAAYRVPDPGYAPFLDVLTGRLRDLEIDDLQNKVALHEAVKLPPNPKYSHQTLSVAVQGDIAIAQECMLDDSIVFDTRDGSTRNGDIGTDRLEMHLEKANGGWRIENAVHLDSVRGEVPCGPSRSL